MPLKRPEELSYATATPQQRADELRIDAYSDITQWREIVEWNIAVVGNGVNIDYERFPYLTHGVVVELRVNGKVAGGAPIVVTLRNNGTVVVATTAILAGTLYTNAPAVAAAVVSPASKLTIDIATGVGWTQLVVAAVIEPTLER